MDPDAFDFEIGVPLTVPVAAAGRAKAGQLPSTTVARTVFHGAYESLGAAWGEFDAWIAAGGLAPTLTSDKRARWTKCAHHRAHQP